MVAPVLVMRGITKRFGGVHAVRGVDFTLNAGEVHALLGENGAGKSTLMNILSGVHAPDQGELLLDGVPVRLASPREAQANGIATIFQELDLVPSLDIAANLFLGRETMRRTGTLDRPAMTRAAQALMDDVERGLDVGRNVGDLSIGQRQLVAIAKALAQATRVLVMDEPTAALTATEVEHLFVTIRRLRARGVGIVYISHRLEEVARIADRATVMRDGRVVGTVAADASQAEIVRLLVGRPLEELFPPKAIAAGAELLRLDRAAFDTRRTTPGWQTPRAISLLVRAGEIVGLAGIMGAGRTELLSALYGTGPAGRWRGGVTVAGSPSRLSNTRSARRAGIGFVTDDRRGAGLMLRMTVGRNLVMSILRAISPAGLMSRSRERRAIGGAIGQFDIRPPSEALVVGNLSGGNQQKVVLARAVLAGPRLLLLDEPTRGVDVGAKAEIYRQLRALAEQGMGVLVASSEMPELIGLCDRVVVLREGRTVAEFGGDIEERAIMAAAA